MGYPERALVWSRVASGFGILNIFWDLSTAFQNWNIFILHFSISDIFVSLYPGAALVHLPMGRKNRAVKRLNELSRSPLLPSTLIAKPRKVIGGE